MGPATIIGQHGTARGADVVVVRGELWTAHSTDDEPLHPGEDVVVESVEHGLTLRVRPLRVHAPA